MTLSRAWAAAAVCALSLLVHSKGLRAPLLDYHYHRQVNTASIARNFAREARPPWSPRVDWEGPADRMAATELPAYMWLYGRLWPVLGLGEAWGRVLSALASMLTALLLFLMLDREFGRAAALAGGLLFSLLPVEVYFGRTVQPEATALLGFVASLYLWEKALGPGRPLLPAAAAALCAALATGLKLPYAHVLIPLFGLSWRRLGRAALTDARGWAAAVLALGLAGSWYLYARRGVYVVPTRGGEFWGILGYERTPFIIQFFLLSRFPEIIATYAGVAMFFVGARRVIVRGRDVFWASWLGGTFVHLIALGAYGHIHEYSCLPIAPAVAAMMGVGLAGLVEKARASRRPAPALAGVALLVLAVPVHMSLRIPHWYKQGVEYVARAGEAAAAVGRPGDLFYTNSRAPSLLLYYLDRRGWGEDLSACAEADFRKRLAARSAEGARFFATEKKGPFAEDGALWAVLRARGAPVWDDGSLAIFALSSPEPAPVDARRALEAVGKVAPRPLAPGARRGDR